MSLTTCLAVALNLLDFIHTLLLEKMIQAALKSSSTICLSPAEVGQALQQQYEDCLLDGLLGGCFARALRTRSVQQQPSGTVHQ
jgi:hypothetical protein